VTASDRSPQLSRLNVAVRDMDATVAFYRTLGLSVAVVGRGEHAVAELPGGTQIEFDTVDFVPQWDTGWRGTTGGSTILGFSVASREAVDELYEDLVAAGYRSHQQPYDAFWGARYAIVEDPDGNGIGLMSPIESARRFWPPQLPPSGP
jgi:uncharacterized glyoxalase superfamily protein PhnB